MHPNRDPRTRKPAGVSAGASSQRVYTWAMAMEFGWWNKDPEEGKYQVLVRFHGGKAEWTRHQGHNTSWLPYPPTPDDWDRLIDEASRRVPRRLISPKQFAEIEALRAKALR